MRLVLAESVRPALSSMALGAHSATPALPQIEHCAIGKGGAPLLVLSLAPGQIVARAHDDGGGAMQAFTWQHEMRCWLRIADTRFVLSEFFSLLDSVPLDPFLSKVATDAPEAPLAQLQARCACPAAAATAAATGCAAGPLSASALLMRGNAAARQSGRDGGWVLSRAHLEDRIASAVAIESSSEFVHWLRLYARHLAASPRGASLTAADMSRVRALCERLLAAQLAAPTANVNGHAPEPVSRTAAGALAWWTPGSPAVLGLNKRQLLRSVVLPAFASNRALQPIISEYMEALRMVEET